MTQLSALHREDPQQRVWKEKSLPYETLYAERMLYWTLQLCPQASEVLQLAVCAQHLQRWKLPRNSYPMDRKGYLLWREDLKKRHVADLAQLMETEGYATEDTAKASELIRRKQVASDPEGQTLEDAACLTFLELDFSELLAKTPADKMVEILRKTWKKMSIQGQAAALKLALSAQELRLVERALSS